MKKVYAIVLISTLLLGFSIARSPVANAFLKSSSIGSTSEEKQEPDEGQETTGEGLEDEDKDEAVDNTDDGASEDKDEAVDNTDDGASEDKDEANNDTDDGDIDQDGDSVDDEKEQNEERMLTTEVSDGTAKVESKFETEDTGNEIKIEFEAKDGVTMELAYRNETENGEEEVKAELELKVVLMTILEYINLDEDPALTEGDEVVQTLDLEELNYTTPEVTTITSIDGEEGYRFEIIGTKGDFTFNVIAVLFSTYALVDDTLVSPTESKITFTFINFPYISEDSTLALRVSAVSEMERQTEEKETEVKVKSDIAEGYFNWESWAMVDGANKTVNHSFTNNDEGTLINLCYPQGSSIIHDPKIGVGLMLPLILPQVFTLVNRPLLVGTSLMALIMMAGTMAMRRRESIPTIPAP